MRPRYRQSGVFRRPASTIRRAPVLLIVQERDGAAGHDCRDGVFVNELGVSIPAQKHAEIVEPGHDALEFDAVNEEYRQRRLMLSHVVEECVL